jgi:ParB family chromosome partitioning protein
LFQKLSHQNDFLRLIKLPEDIQESLRNNKISMGHARALLAFDSSDKMMNAHKKIIADGLSVRATESLIKDSGNSKSGKDGSKPDVKSPEINDLEEKLRHRLATEVKISSKNNKSGKIVIDFYSEDDFERIIEQIING